MPASPSTQHVELVRTVFLDCWNEFYKWKRGFAATELAKLSGGAHVKVEGAAPHSEPFLFDHLASRSEDSLDDLDYDSGTDPEPEQGEVRLWLFDTDNAVPQTSVRSTIVTGPVVPHKQGEDDLTPVPPYEACVPLLQQNSLTDTPAEQEKLEFVPFADEPAFEHDYPYYLELPEEETYQAFDYQAGEREARYDFAWKEGDRNPDADMIVREAARRLHFNHSLTLKDIDGTQILPFDLIQRDGTAWNPARTRTLLPWPPSSQDDRESGKTYEDIIRPSKTLSPVEVIESMNRDFCGRLGCLQFMCPTHGRALSTPPNLFRANNLTAGDIIERSSRVRNPCGDDCYKVPAHENQASASLTKWTDRELENLKMFASALDAPTVCALAASMYPRTCSETFIALHSLDLDPSPLSNNEQAGNSDKPAKRSWKKFPDEMYSEYQRYELIASCNHTGPCDKNKDCVCSRAGQWCKRGCGCTSKCTRRLPGCSCRSQKGGVVCDTERCPCFNHKTECDPDVCGSCGSKAGTPCANAGLLHGRKKATRVVMKQYQWGPAWGLILEEPVKTGEFIDEYIGEIITDAEYKARLPIATYLGRNYFFSLDSTRTIDGARASNNTRYINHAAKAAEGLNVDTSMRFVEGEPRLGFFARKKIKAGEELLFDYGEFYWIGDTEGVSERLMVSPGRPKGQRRKTSRSRSRTETVETSDTSRTEDSITEPSRKGSRDTSETDDDSVGSTSTERGMVNLARHGAKKSAWPAFQPAVRREVGRGSYLAGESDEEDELVYDSGV
ncbi:hypothetical protein FRB94_007687 [Tulasnella sp. JGI-2019a]|nr:hypothetical protein FRB94_007687 [Tulasnella sp. JGI-2019a]